VASKCDDNNLPAFRPPRWTTKWQDRSTAQLSGRWCAVLLLAAGAQFCPVAFARRRLAKREITDSGTRPVLKEDWIQKGVFPNDSMSHQ